LVPDLLALLTCRLVVPYTSFRENGVNNASIASEAAFAIEQIGVAPDIAALRQLITDPQRFDIPHVAYKMFGHEYGSRQTTCLPCWPQASCLSLVTKRFELAAIVVPYLSDSNPEIELDVKVAITLLAERARDQPTPAAAPMMKLCADPVSSSADQRGWQFVRFSPSQQSHSHGRNLRNHLTPCPIPAQRPARIGWIVLALYVAYASTILDITWERFVVGSRPGPSLHQPHASAGFRARQAALLSSGMIESLQIAIVATVVGVLISLPLGLAAARNLSPSPLAWTARALIALFRTFIR
jgi:hypothetical protein